MVFRLAYVSRAAEGLARQEIESIAVQSEEKNSELGITGFLCYRNGTFLQYLEGGETEVRDLLEVIRRDDRHTMLSDVELGVDADRLFEGWAMKYLDDHFFGMIAMEDVLEGAIRAMAGTGGDTSYTRSIADRIVRRIAELRAGAAGPGV